jgi:hypothetical protein
MIQISLSYGFVQQKEAVQAYEDLLNSKEELEEKDDILRFFKVNPVLIPMMADLVSMSTMDIDVSQCEVRLWHDFICDGVFGDSGRNTYCLIEFEDAKKNSIFDKKPQNHPKFARRFECGISQIIDWFWKIDALKNTSTEIEHLFQAHNPTIRAILIIGRTSFLKNNSEKARLKWRKEKTIIDSKKIECITYDDLLDYFKGIIKKKEKEKLLDME